MGQNNFQLKQEWDLHFHLQQFSIAEISVYGEFITLRPYVPTSHTITFELHKEFANGKCFCTFRNLRLIRKWRHENKLLFRPSKEQLAESIINYDQHLDHYLGSLMKDTINFDMFLNYCSRPIFSGSETWKQYFSINWHNEKYSNRRRNHLTIVKCKYL